MIETKYVYLRKLIHIVSGILFIVVASYYHLAIWLLGIAVFLAIMLDRMRNLWPQWNHFFQKIFNSLLKENERTGEISGAVSLWFALYLVYLLFPLPIFQISGSVSVLADPAGAIIGHTAGGKQIFKDKTLSGSLACFAVAFILLWRYWNIPLLPSLILSIILMGLEVYAPQKWENFVITLSSAILVQLSV